MEKEADVLKKDLRLHMPKGMFMPVPRADLLDLLTTQDKIANQAKDIAGIILGRQMQIPESLHSIFKNYVSRSVDASKQAKKAISELDELYETGFRGREVDVVQGMIMKLNEIEHDTDDMQVDIRHRLFEIEKELPAVDVMFLYRVIESIGELADCAQRVGSRLQLLLAH